ncbi:phosphomevalonate kinase [Facklamia sp. DSM 111018]|uniref:phosphomevalonate kinase n=1 Tax=Facklamia lactis TaxID=2749967 RepID=A0ABS0LQF4_9LACT|nr:phosphomevalonate kinase [Facklamia lactis]MBG9986384.1 phosphomevalonate kinase [Facklamia lactis]
MELFDRFPLPKQAQALAPGKLYIVGEYAILAPQQAAILIGLDQYIQAKVSFNDLPYCELFNHQKDYPPLNIYFDTNEDSSKVETSQFEKWNYVIEAVKTCRALLAELKIPFRNCQIDLNSELTNPQGQKYGFGSSGAVTVACIQAILKAHGLEARSKITYFKLAVITMLRLKSRGSFGDLACNVMGGWVYYQAADRGWLEGRVLHASYLDLLTEDWPDLIIESLQAPANLHLLIGWTQQPASTENLVDRLQQLLIQDPTAYQKFLQEAKPCVDQLKEALIDHQEELILQSIHHYRQLLLNLGTAYGLPIETKPLQQLIEIAQSYSFSAKSSGAGGGDCGIALGFDPSKIQMIQKAWKQNGIEPLNCKIIFSKSSQNKE